MDGNCHLKLNQFCSCFAYKVSKLSCGSPISLLDHFAGPPNMSDHMCNIKGAICKIYHLIVICNIQITIKCSEYNCYMIVMNAMTKSFMKG